MYQYLGTTDISMYFFVGYISHLTVFIYNLSKYSEKKMLVGKRTLRIYNHCYKRPFIKLYKKLSNLPFWITLEILLITIVQYEFIGYANVTFGHLVGTGANYFGLAFFIPPLLVLLFLYLQVDPFRQMDLITPAYPLGLFISKLACFCHGCCGGFMTNAGLYNHLSGAKEFPVQLVEALFALIIFLILSAIRKNVKTGTLFPIYLICYSSSRFFSEFLRFEDNILWCFKKYHFLCMLGIIVGLIELYYVNKYRSRITSYLEKNWTKKGYV